MLPSRPTHRPARAQRYVGEEGRIRLGGLILAAVPGSRCLGHASILSVPPIRLPLRIRFANSSHICFLARAARSWLSVMVQVAPLTERREVKQACGLRTLVIHVSRCEHHLRPGDRMRLIVSGAAPFAAIPRPDEPHESGAQLPVGRIALCVLRIDWHGPFSPFRRDGQPPLRAVQRFGPAR